MMSNIYRVWSILMVSIPMLSYCQNPEFRQLFEASARLSGDWSSGVQPQFYAIAMINNLAHELVNLGIPVGEGVAVRDTPYSME
ncbi:MAG: hypothetical protein AAFO07_26950 [Bacteroidota bacterium]